MEILKRYVKIATMEDLRFLATEYAVNRDFEALFIVTQEIEKRIQEDKKITKAVLDEHKPDEKAV